MHLIFGGAYQGKLDYARERYQLKEQDIFCCSAEERDAADAGGIETGPSCVPETNFIDHTPEIDFTKKAIDRLEEFVLRCVRFGVEPRDYLELNREKWKNMVFICTDISLGVVPCDKEQRAWREMVGRTLTYLGKEAEEVTRLFCGIPQRVK